MSITVETHLYKYDRHIGYCGYGSATCPYCGGLTDVGTGEHTQPDIAKCRCGKWFRYWPNGRTQRIAPKTAKVLQLD